MTDDVAMTELTSAEIDELQADLKAAQKELETALAAHADNVKTVELDQPIGRLTRMDAMQQQKMAQAERRRREIRQMQVKAALLAIENGDYGFCRQCEEPIGFRRLKARPESPFCLHCANAAERR